jgi:hypothetical protein
MGYSLQLRRILRAYGARVIRMPPGCIPTGMRIPNSTLGIGCDPGTRCIYVDPEQQLHGGVAGREELILHELCHIVVQPPGLNIRTVPELAILLPFERALIHEHLPVEHRANAISFQSTTDLRFDYRGRHIQQFWELGYDHPLFTQGTSMCKRLGLLNDRGCVILGKYPDWSKKNLAAFKRRAARMPVI